VAQEQIRARDLCPSVAAFPALHDRNVSNDSPPYQRHACHPPETVSSNLFPRRLQVEWSARQPASRSADLTAKYLPYTGDHFDKRNYVEATAYCQVCTSGLVAHRQYPRCLCGVALLTMPILGPVELGRILGRVDCRCQAKPNRRTLRAAMSRTFRAAVAHGLAVAVIPQTLQNLGNLFVNGAARPAGKNPLADRSIPTRRSCSLRIRS
jgi:hypothetical protein